MKLSWLRMFQWIGILAALVFAVALRYEAPSEAGMRMNASPESPLSQSLRGYWKLDDGTGTNATDASGNGNTLAMTGSPSWTTGNIGPSALTFSGTAQYLSVADPSSGVLDMTNGTSFSLSGWFNRSSFAADHTVIAKKNDQTTGAGYVVWIDNNGSTDYLFFEASDGTHTYQIQSTTDFSATGWHHFSITWNDAATTTPVNLYIDGKLDNGTTSGTFSSVGDLSNALAFRIGAESDAGVPFAGSLDDIRVYGYALSGEEVKKLYNTTAPAQPVDTSLVGHWTFDGPDIQGTTAIDRSGKGNNGTITGAVPTLGKLGQGLSFDGSSSYIFISDADSLSFTNGSTDLSYSISTWVYMRDITQTAGIVSKWQVGGYAEWILYIDGSALYIENYGWYNSEVVGRSASLSMSNQNKWVHIVATYSGSATAAGFTLYIDGVRADTTNTVGGSYTGTSNTDIPVRIGAYNGAANFFNGKIDDVRIYNRVLSLTEVTDLYNAGK